MAIVCSIPESNQKKFKEAVAKELHGYMTEGEVFNLRKFTDNFYETLKDITDNNKDTALNYAMLIPKFVQDIMVQDTQVMTYLNKTPNILEEIAKAKELFESDLENIEAYIGTAQEKFNILTNLAQQNIDMFAKSSTIETRATSQTFVNEKARDVNRPLSALKTGIGNAESIKEGTPGFNVEIPSMQIITNIKKMIVSLVPMMKSTDDTVTLNNVGKVYLAPFTYTQILEMKQNGAIIPDHVMERIQKQGVGLVLVNEEGYPVFFDEELKDSIDNTTGNAYVDAFVSISKGQLEGTEPLFQEHTDMINAVSRVNKISQQEASSIIQQELQKVYDMKQFAVANPNELLMLPITGGKGGYIHYDYNISNPISAINFGEEGFKPIVAYQDFEYTTEKKGKTYFYLRSIPGIAIEIERPNITPEFASELANLLTAPLSFVSKSGLTSKVPDIVRANIASHYLFLNEKGLNVKFDVETGEYSITLFGRPVDLSNSKQAYEIVYNQLSKLSPKRILDNKDAVQRIQNGATVLEADAPQSEYKLNALIKSVGTKGEEVYKIIEYSKMHFTNEGLTKGYVEFRLKPFQNGFLLDIEEKDVAGYKEFMKKNGIIHYQLNAENKIVSMNPYLTYSVPDEVLNKLYPVPDIEPPAPSTDTTGDANLSDYDFLSDWEGMDKNLRQKMLNAGVDKETLDKIVDWYKSTDLAAKFPLRVMFNVVNIARPNSVATFFQNGITLWKGSDYSDIYHEAWHGFSQFYLTKKQKDELYDSLRKKKGFFIDFEGKTQNFFSAKDKQLEEYIAEDFREYMLNGQKAKKNEPVRNNIFRKIYEALKALFEKMDLVDTMVSDYESNPLIKQYYDVLRVGNLSEYTFNQENLQFKEGLDKTLEATNKDEPIQSLSREASKLIKDSTDALLSEYRFNMNKPLRPDQRADFNRLIAQPFEQLTDVEKARLAIYQKKELGRFTVIDLLQPKKLSKAYKYVKERFRLNYETFSQELNDLIAQKRAENPAFTEEDIQALPDVKELNFKVDALGYALRNFGDVDNIENNQQYKGVVGYHFAKSEYISQQIRENLLMELDEEQDKEDFKLFEKSGADMSFIAMADKEILYLVAGLHRVDEQGDVELNKLGFPKLVNGKSVMNKLAKTLNSLQSPQQMAAKLQKEIENGNLIFKQLLDELGSAEEFQKANVYEMWDKFWNTFNLTRISPVMQNFYTDVEITETVDEYGRKKTTRKNPSYRVVTGNSPNLDIENIKNKWNVNFQKNIYSEFLKQGPNGRYLDAEGLTKMIRKYGDNIVGREQEFLAELGIIIPEQAFESEYATELNKKAKFVFLKLKEAEKKNAFKDKGYTFKPIYGLQGLIEPFHDDIKILSGNLDTDIKDLAKIADKFSESSSEFMFTTASGDTKYELSKNSTITQKINAINEVNYFDDLISRPEFAHFSKDLNSFVRFTVRFNTIFDFSKPRGPKRTYNAQGKESNDPSAKPAMITYKDLSGILTLTNDAVDNNGKISASLSEFEKLVHDIHSVLSGNIEHPRHSDKSTYSSVGVTNYLIGSEGRKRFIDIYDIVNPNDFTTDEYRMLHELEKEYEVKGENMEATRLSKLRSMQQSTKYYNKEAKNIFKNVFFKYIAAEHGRILKFKNTEKAYNESKGLMDFYMDFDYLKRGQKFHIFDKILSPSTKTAIMNLKVPLEDVLEQDPNNEIFDKIMMDLRHYFEDQVSLAYDKMPFIAPNVFADIQRSFARQNKMATEESMKRGILRAYTISTFMSIFEDMTMFYGDIAEYLMEEKDEGHKRNSLFGSFGDVARNDKTAQLYINSIGRRYAEANKLNNNYTDYNGQLRTAVLEDVTAHSKYVLTNYIPAVIEDAKRNLLKNPANQNLSEEELNKRAKDIAYKSLKEYGLDPKTGKLKDKMKVADAQGWITFDSYRIVLKLYRKWTPQQEDMYQKIVKGEDVSAQDVLKTFPVVKLQYSGALQNEYMASMAAHKYSLLPLVPTVIKTKGLEKLHTRLMEQGLDYAVMKSGSKISTITKNGVADKFYSNKETGEVDMSKVAVNTIYVPFLKYQTHVEPEFKGQISFFSQMRKLIENNIFEGGVPTDFMPEETDLDVKIAAWNAIGEGEEAEIEKESKSQYYKLVVTYENNLRRLVEKNKDILLKEIDWKYVNGKLSGDISKLLEFVEKEMLRQNVSEQELEIISEMKKGSKHDLSMLLSAEKIEKLLNAIIVRRLVKPKIKGEGLIQVSNVGFENSEDFQGGTKFEMATDEQLEKYGTWDLPATRLLRRPDGSYYVRGAKVKIAIQGDFKKLLKLKEVQDLAAAENITPLQALNRLIKTEEWLDKGDNRKMVRMVGARIPTQGHNSMEYVEVFEFLPEEAANIIVLPYEIVAKSGSDFDVDKLFMMMPNIDRKVIRAKLTNKFLKDLQKEYTDLDFSRENVNIVLDAAKGTDGVYTLTPQDQRILDILEEFSETEIGLSKSNSIRGIENDLLDNIADLLQLPENFVSIITPNDVSIAKDLADTLAKVNRTYNMYNNPWGEDLGYISSTNFFEFGHNLFKHSSNSVGKQTLGLGAVDNTFNAIFNRIGMYLNADTVIKGQVRRVGIKLNHNKYIRNGREVISLSHLMDANGQYKISEVISQMINGWVDVAKDAWIFDIQGNKIVSPTLLFMIQAGVPFEEAVYFVSQPIIVEYINEMIEHQGIFSETKGKKPDSPFFAEFSARKAMMVKYQNVIKENLIKQEANKFNPSSALSGNTIYSVGKKITDNNLQAFTLPFLQNNIKNRKAKVEDLAILFHFFELQDHSKSLRNIKLKMNFDTAKSPTLYDAMKKERAVSEVRADGRIPSEMVDRILKQTPIGPFFVQQFQQEVWGDLFELRNHDKLNRAIMSISMTKANEISKLFGDEEKAVLTIKNDINAYVFQNAVKAFDEKGLKYYKGLDVNMEVEEVRGISYGAIVGEKNGKKVLFVNRDVILEEFRSSLYTKKDYNLKGYATVAKEAFASMGFKEYMRFVIERAVLEDMYEYGDVYQRLDYRFLLENNMKNNPVLKQRGQKIISDEDLSNLEQYLKKSNNKLPKEFFTPKTKFTEFYNPQTGRRESAPQTAIWMKNTQDLYDLTDKVSGEIYIRDLDLRTGILMLDAESPQDYQYRMATATYKQWLRDKALSNIFNVWHMFYSPTSFADTYGRIFSEYGTELSKNYTLMEGLVVQARQKSSPSAIKFVDPRADNDTLDIYRDEILSLSNETVKKVDNEQDDKMITEFFKMFSIYAMFQAGTTDKGPFAIGKIANTRQILSILEPAAKQFIKEIEKNDAVLDEYLDKVFKIYANKAISSKLKNYVLPRKDQRFYQETVYYNDSVAIYDLFRADENTIRNSNGYFVYDSDENNTKSKLPGLALTNSDIGKTIAFRGKINQSSQESSYYKDTVNADGTITMNPKLKENIDEFIDLLSAAQSDGIIINFPTQGIGQYMIGLDEALQRKKDPVYGKYDSTKMYAPESFKYLSEQLFEKFGYINPNSMDLNIPEIIKQGVAILPVVQVEYGSITKSGVISTQLQAPVSAVNNPAEYTNYHGGAEKYDTYWEQDGKNSGVTKHTVYTTDSYNALDKATKDKLEDRYQSARTWLGRGNVAVDTYNGKLVRRDMMQAAKADGIFAVSEIVAPGTKGRKGYVNKTDHPIVEGGTGYAVASGILLGKPVYVFNQDSSYGYDTGWYKWDSTANNFVKTDTPVLTKNYAGIGSHTYETEIGRQAIRDVYSNTFKSAQPSQQQGNIKEGVKELFESNLKLATIGTPEQYSQYLDTIFPDSKVKDIVYKGAPENYPIQKSISPSLGEGITFTSDKEWAKSYTKGGKNPTLYTALINVKNPIILNDNIDNLSETEQDNYIKQKNTKINDGTISLNEYLVVEPEQIHILGSKQDIEGFKKFTQQQDGVTNLLPTIIEKDENDNFVIKIDTDLVEQMYNDKAWTKEKVGKPLPADAFVSVEDYMNFLINRTKAKSYIQRTPEMSNDAYVDAVNNEALLQTGKIEVPPIAISDIKNAGTMNYISGQLGNYQTKIGYFNKDILAAKITDTWNAIVNGFRTQTTRDQKAVNYNVGDYIYFTNTYFTKLKGQRLVVQVTELSDKNVGELLKEDPNYAETWSKNEGWTTDLLKGNPGLMKKYPVKFKYIGVQDANGNWLQVSDEYKATSRRMLTSVEVPFAKIVPAKQLGIRPMVEMKNPDVTDDMVMDKLKFCGIFTPLALRP